MEYKDYRMLIEDRDENLAKLIQLRFRIDQEWTARIQTFANLADRLKFMTY